MAYEAKTNWKLDDTVMPDDMNRIEQGIKDVENSLATAGGLKVLEASEDSKIDFNALTESGIYLIKNASNTTTLNYYEGVITGIPTDIKLEVRVNNSETPVIHQLLYARSQQIPYRRTFQTEWSEWEINFSANNVDAGTFNGMVVANATAVETYGTAQVRNIKASTTDLTAGSSTLATGDIYLVYS